MIYEYAVIDPASGRVMGRGEGPEIPPDSGYALHRVVPAGVDLSASYWLEDEGFVHKSDPRLPVPSWFADPPAAVAPSAAAQLVRARAVAVGECKRLRDAAIFGGFDWDGSRFDSDDIAQSRLLGLFVQAQSSPASFPITWRLADNTWRALSAADAAALYAAMVAHLQGQFALFAQREADILACASPQQITDYMEALS